MRITGICLAFIALSTNTIAQPIAFLDASIVTTSPTLNTRDANPAGGLAGLFSKAFGKLVGGPKQPAPKWTPATPQSPGTIEKNLADRRKFHGPFARPKGPQNSRLGAMKPPPLRFIPSNKGKLPIPASKDS
ncbi:hypothetical protein Slin14017_G035770 [Septoria linicola]|nr:hypothetical protein Slin14017_G035770 [Septoria linicola]